MKDEKEKYQWLKALLTGWGIKESWAKLIAGAIIGAICAFMMTSCTWDIKSTSSSQNFDSSITILPVTDWKK
jgi:hypothetical protein